MIVHIIGSLRQFDEDKTYILKIVETTEKIGGRIAFDWISSAISRRQRGQLPVEQTFDWSELVESNIHAISRCDAVIVEGSRFNYSQGYQTAIALQYNKPVLNLYRQNLPEYKEWPDRLFVSGINHPLFSSKAYSTEQELEMIVTNFLRDHTKEGHELDIKLSLDDTTYRKLREATDVNHKSEAGIVRDILLKALNEQ